MKMRSSTKKPPSYGRVTRRKSLPPTEASSNLTVVWRVGDISFVRDRRAGTIGMAVQNGRRFTVVLGKSR